MRKYSTIGHSDKVLMPARKPRSSFLESAAGWLREHDTICGWSLGTRLLLIEVGSIMENKLSELSVLFCLDGTVNDSK